MKTLRNEFWALLLITSVAFLSCKKQDQLVPVKPASNIDTASTNNPNFTRGEWKVETFRNNNVDETTIYRGYLFMFNSNRTVTAKKDNNTVSGTWSTVKNNNPMKFMVSFPSDPLNKLNGDWDVKNESVVDLALERKRSDGSIDNLTFTRYFAQAAIGSYK